MGYAIRANRLRENGQDVELMASPFTGGDLPSPTRILVIHFTYGASGRSSARWFCNPKNPHKSSAHLVVDRDGSSIQCVRFNTVAHHAGRSRWKDIVGLNRHSIGIELANWGYLRSSGPGWESYTGVPIPNPVMAVHENGNPHGGTSPIGWEPYPAVQIENAVAIARVLVETYGITQIVGHDDIAPGRKWDPGPAFDMARFRAQVFGGRADDGDIRRSVSAADGLNLRSGPGVSYPAVRLLPQGTEIEPIESQGHWLSVSVIGADGEATATGWVHERYLD